MSQITKIIEEQYTQGFVLFGCQVTINPPHVSMGSKAIHSNDAQNIVHGEAQLHASVHLRIPCPAPRGEAQHD